MTTTVATDLVAAYHAPPGAFDEMVGPDGVVRDHWGRIGQALDGLGLPELWRRWAEAARLLDEDGVTYNVYGGHRGARRRWALDPVPLLVTSEEWAGIESAVIQRAELLNLVLTDLYGPRDLIRRGLLPAELIYGHPGFLRQCDQIKVRGPLQLFTIAVDVARDCDGQRWVLADRTQAPSGAGYALENRMVVSRVFPSVYRDAQVHRLASFFRALRSGLQAVAPRTAADPRIVVLTPGARSETAFEHAFLAAHLGYQLVEGSDLTVSGGRVWMRSLGRLEPVDVILRRVDTWFCDPLELRPDSYLGVPGLLEACRRGTVSVVNTLGSGALENPGLLPFLPRLAERLLGESLELPSVPTWWCGEPAGRSHVLANLERLVVKPIAKNAGGDVSQVTFGWQQSDEQLDQLRRRIQAQPHFWVGQEQLALASAPTLGERGLEARRSVLRAFAVARGDSYLAMPGGLTRVSATDGAVITNQAGAISKDTWILASEPEQLAPYWWSAGPAVPPVEPAASVSARVAENLVWLGRYAERAEDTVRVLRVVYDRRNEFADGTSPGGDACLRALLGALTHVTNTYPGFVGDGARERLAHPAEELQSLAVDAEREGTIAFAVQHMLDAAYAARDQLSGDTWVVVSALRRDLLDIPSLGRETLRRVLANLLALSGLGAESLVRDPSWRFMDAGRRIERGIQLGALLRATVTTGRGEEIDSLLMESVLIAAESIITYRRRYRSHAQLETLLDLLLLDPDNPRSLVYQLDRLLEDLRALPGHPGPSRVSEAEKPVLEASTALRVADTGALARSPAGALDIFLVGIVNQLQRAADAIAAVHFTHPLPQRALLTPADSRAARATHMFLP